MTRSRFHMTLAVMQILALAAVAETNTPRYAIHLVDLVETDDVRHANITREDVFAAAVKREPPVLTETDIVELCWATQRLVLTDEGAHKWDALGGFDTPLTGRPLVVSVDGEMRYAAMLWNPLSSLAPRLPQIWCKTIENNLTMGCRYMSAEGDTILGDCYDPEVKRVLTELGKVTEDCRGE